MANLRGLYDKIVSLVKSSDVVAPDTYTPISTDLVAVYDSNGPSTESGEILAPKKFVSVTDIGTGGGGGGGTMSSFDVTGEGGIALSLDGDTYSAGPLTVENIDNLRISATTVPSGLNWEGAYSSGSTYVVNDVVYTNYGDPAIYQTWFAISSVSAGQAPPTSGTSNAYWALLGTQGPTGSTGPAGPNVGSAVLGFRTVTASTQLYADALPGTTNPIPQVNDRGVTILVNSSSFVGISIPQNLSTNSNIGFPIGYQVSIITINTGPVSILPNAGVELYSADNARYLRTQYSGCTLVRQGTNTWYMFGDLTNIS